MALESIFGFNKRSKLSLPFALGSSSVALLFYA